MTSGAIARRISEKLSRAFVPERLEIIDESHLHKGHAGHHPEGESHFRIHIVSEAFVNKRAVERHRMVNRILAEELVGRVHALALELRAPGED